MRSSVVVVLVSKCLYEWFDVVYEVLGVVVWLNDIIMFVVCYEEVDWDVMNVKLSDYDGIVVLGMSM